MQNIVRISGVLLGLVLLALVLVFSIVSINRTGSLQSELHEMQRPQDNEALVALIHAANRQNQELKESLLAMQTKQDHTQNTLNTARAELGWIQEDLQDTLAAGFPASAIFNRTHEGVVEIRTDSHVLLGTGFLISSDEIATALHVVEDTPPWNLKIVTVDGETVYVENLKRDAEQDLAILKLDDSLAQAPLQLGDSSALSVGDPLLTVGHPFGLSFTASQGVVSGLNRIGQDHEMVCTKCTGLIQMDALTNGGSSGGPVVNIQGQVVGMVSSSTGNFSFAIASRHIRNLYEEPYEETTDVPTGAMTLGPGWRENSPSPVREGELAVLWMFYPCHNGESAELERAEFSVRGGTAIEHYSLVLDNVQIGRAPGGTSPTFVLQGVNAPTGKCSILELIGLVGNVQEPGELQVTLTNLEARGVRSGNLVRITGFGQGNIRHLESEPAEKFYGERG